jgi:hypothetical protein
MSATVLDTAHPRLDKCGMGRYTLTSLIPAQEDDFGTLGALPRNTDEAMATQPAGLLAEQPMAPATAVPALLQGAQQ